jgi:hypothetical protein
MTDSDRSASGERGVSTPPSRRQLNYLRSLAMQRGETFAVPRSSIEASAEIDRLKGRRRMTRAEHRMDQAARKRDLAEMGRDATTVLPSEIEGYGGSARWRRD